MINELKLFDNIFLIPIFRINVTVKISELNKSSLMTKSISNWEIIEKLRKLSPKTLTEGVVFKVHKSTTDFLTFSADLKTRIFLKLTIANIDKKKIKLNGFSDQLAVEATEEKNEYPRNHDWNSYFRDAAHIHENEPGLRPDTIIIHNLPIIWFHRGEKNSLDEIIPSEVYVWQVFETFGEINRIDIPMIDPIQNFSLISKIDQLKRSDVTKICNYLKDNCENSEKIFDGIVRSSTALKFTVFIQYKSILGFSKAIDSLRGSKLIIKDTACINEKISNAEIKIDFDRNGHLSDRMLKKRQKCSERLVRLIQKRQKIINKEIEKDGIYLEEMKLVQNEEEKILNETKSRVQIEFEKLKFLEKKKKLIKVANKECKREMKVLKKQLQLYEDFHKEKQAEQDKILRFQTRLCKIIPLVDKRREELRSEAEQRELAKKKIFENELKRNAVTLTDPSSDSVETRLLSRLEERMRRKLIAKRLKLMDNRGIEQE